MSWFKRGPSPEYLSANAVQPRPQISEKEIVRRIAADLSNLAAVERASARYLSIAHLHNNASISPARLELYRQGVVKMLNSLSRVGDVLGLDTSRAPQRLAAVDPERTILRLDLRHVGWSSPIWDRVAKHYPYTLLPRNGPGNDTEEPAYLRADWFVFATSQPPLYHDLVGIPATLAELEKSLGIDRLKAIGELRVARSGFENSKVSVNNRLLERIALPTRGGGYHLSYDFGSNLAAQNFFENPLGPVGALPFPQAFRHDGGEVIYPLPNGFSAYMLVAADGQRLDIAPQAIVSDNTMPGGLIINGVSCISCHLQGMKPEAGDARLKRLDEVRDAALVNFRRFDDKARETIEQIYKPHDHFAQLIEADRRRFLEASAAAGIEVGSSEEPVRALFDRFAKDLDVDAVAAEFGLAPAEFRQKMNREGETRELLSRIQRGTLKRQLYLSSFATIARLTGAGDTRKFASLGFPYFGERPALGEKPNLPVVPDPPLGGAKTEDLWVRHGFDLLDAENREGEFQVKVWTEDNVRNYREDETIPCFIRANRDCFLTVLCVDPTGDIVQLVPNKEVPKLTLAAGRTLPISKDTIGWEFFASEPHGLTELRVIATKRFLEIPAAAQAGQGQGPIKLGNSKGIRFRSQPQPMPVRPAALGEKLTSKKLNELFQPNEWATASWNVTTRK